MVELVLCCIVLMSCIIIASPGMRFKMIWWYDNLFLIDDVWVILGPYKWNHLFNWNEL